MRRWREVLAGAGVALGGLWVALVTFGLTRWLGVTVALAGLALAWAGVRRLRFARGGGGQGVVSIDERRLTYWGPLAGGVLDLDDLARLDLDGRGRPAHWVLTGADGERLAIPADARGADALFDLFAALPGLDTGAMLAALNDPARRVAAIWAAPGAPESLRKHAAPRALGPPGPRH